MTKRIKLLRVKTCLNIEMLHDYFHRTKFAPGSNYGFLNSELLNKKIHATYVELESSHQEFTDPLGEVYEQTLITYNTFKFTIEPLTNSILIMSIVEPPRTIKNFINIISKDLNYLVAFSSASISINNLLNSLYDNKEISLIKIKKLKISGMKLNDSSLASIEITSKKNAFDDLADYTKSSQFTIDKIKGDMFNNNRSITFEITKTGSFCISDDECTLDFLFDAIQR